MTKLSQFFNSLTGGNPNITMSAKVGRLSIIGLSESDYPFFFYLEKFIDFAFYPIDGRWNHCYHAMMIEAEYYYELFDDDSNEFLLALFCIIGCIPISIYGYLSLLIKKIK